MCKHIYNYMYIYCVLLQYGKWFLFQSAKVFCGSVLLMWVVQY